MKASTRTTTTAFDRRRFCKGLIALAAASTVPVLSACSAFEPRPFTTGDTVPAPMGCSELLARNPRGDC